MNVLELLAKSAEVNHGRKLEAPQVKELLSVFQALQQQALNVQARLEGLTRIAVVQNQTLGGSLGVTETAFDEAEGYGLNVVWDDEGGTIEVTTYQVDVPDVQVGDDPTDDEEQPGLASVPDEGTEGPLEGPASDSE